MHPIRWITCALAALVLPMTAIPAAASAAELALKLAESDRPAEDKARDAGRKPGEVITFLGIEPGMTVIDLIAASGYYSEALSIAVGPTGKVYAQNTEFALKLREGVNDKAMIARLAGGRLPNVERLDRELSDLGLAPGSIDAAVTALNFHDIVNGRGPEATASLLAAVMAVLKPGGIFGVVDHHGDAGKDNEKLHRMPEADARKAIEAAGFEITASGDMLRNPADDRSLNVFDPSVRGRTDRFVLLARKPGER